MVSSLKLLSIQNIQVSQVLKSDYLRCEVLWLGGFVTSFLEIDLPLFVVRSHLVIMW